jgi:group I intron endonuclease
MKIDKSYSTSGIYKIKCIITSYCYIGSSKNIYKRLHYHISRLRSDKHFNKFLQNSFNKNGEDNFVTSVLEFCEVKDLHQKEEFYLSNEKLLYNFNIKPNGPIKLPSHCDDVKLKISKSLTGRKRTEEQRERMRKSQTGKKLSDETKLKKSKSMKENFEKNKEIMRKKLSEAGKLGAKKSLDSLYEKNKDGHRVEWETFTCPQCNNKIMLQPHLARTKKYCSIKCRGENNRGKDPWNKGKTKVKQK